MDARLMNMKLIDSVLITGGTGFFGRAMIKHLLTQTSVSRICILSRDEAKQAVLRTLTDDPQHRLHWFLGDVRDQARLRRAMQDIDLVISAAALKRIETGFYNPTEMIKTNVIGAMNIIEAATDAKVKKVVALSTDKAHEPVSPYGQSKALAESLFLNANNARGAYGPRYAVVRYGNVWNSTGSVVPTWKTALKEGRNIHLTDPDCTRFFMTVNDAVTLVWRTALEMKGGELQIPDLPAYRLGDLLQAMTGGGAKETVLLGLPEYEKKHESMCAGRSSDIARRMSIEELREALKSIE